MNYPSVSIVIVTCNSEKTLPKTLQSIKKQNYPQKKIEVIVVDGKSQDNTRIIAKKFGCKILDNPEIGFIPGKYLGFTKASSDYLLFHDSDEEIESPNSLKIKISAFKKNKGVKGVISTGYINPKDFPAINRYINEFGDPFSYFIYRESINVEFFLNQMKERYKKVVETKDFVIFDFSKSKSLPLIELYAMGSMIDLKFTKEHFSQIKKNHTLISHFFYLITQAGFFIAITKNDGVIHYSSNNFKGYLNKIAWRVRNNIYNKNSTGLAGYRGRDSFQPLSLRLKKFLFIPYSFTFLLPFFDGINLSLKRKDLIFLIHPILCIYTSCVILYHYTLSLFGFKLTKKRYGT